MLLLPLQQAFGLAQPYLMKIGIDQYIANRDLGGLQNVGLLFLGALAGETVTVFFHYYLTMLVAQRCLADLRVAVFAHVQKLPMSYFDRNPVGRLVTRMTTRRGRAARDVFFRRDDVDLGFRHGVLDRRHHVLSRRQAGARVAGIDPADGHRDQFFPRSRRARPTA